MLLSSCVWESDYDTVVAENQQLKVKLAQSLAEQNFVVAGDALFPSGGYQLSPGGQAELTKNVVPRLKVYDNVKIVVYGHTDNTPVLPKLQQQGIPDNWALSTLRATAVVSYLMSKGINPDTISAKGFGDTRPVTPNDTPEGRAANRRIVITVEGLGPSGS